MLTEYIWSKIAFFVAMQFDKFDVILTVHRR